MRYLIIYITLILSFIAIHCNQINNPILSDALGGTYSYVGYDSLSNQIAKGWIKFEFEDSVNIKGNWQVEKTVSTGSYGPQDGNGNLVGDITDTSIYMNLHPNYADNNIILLGEFNGINIEGEWQWITFIGLTNSGTFKASRKSFLN